ncbi:hypothetical protein D9M71_408300 [compost metagenome]
MADLAVLVVYRPDALPLRVERSILAAIPDFAAPVLLLADVEPHVAVELRIVPARLQQVRCLAESFGLAVASDAAEGRIDIGDA